MVSSGVISPPTFIKYCLNHRFKVWLCLLLLTGGSLVTRAQKVDSIFFNLYTDSLKKGVHNYINIDGKLSNGKWLPLTAREIDFSTSDGSFAGNSLVLDTSFKGKKVTIKAVLKADPSISKEVTIYIKTLPDNEKLKTVDEILDKPAPRSRRSKKNRGT